MDLKCTGGCGIVFYNVVNTFNFVCPECGGDLKEITDRIATSDSTKKLTELIKQLKPGDNVLRSFDKAIEMVELAEPAIVTAILEILHKE